MGLDIESACALCTDWREQILGSDFRINPWQPSSGPRLELQKAHPRA
jgi:hypothetical protein